MYVYEVEYYQFINISVLDLILVPFIVGVVFFLSYAYMRKHIDKDPVVRYLPLALALKLFGALGFCITYMFFYGGDTYDYFNSAVALNNLISYDTSTYFKIMTGGPKPDYYFAFTSETGFPEWHMWRDPKTFFVIRLISPIVLLSGKSFIISTLLLALISFVGLWKMYLLLCSLYPNLIKQFAFSVLLVPSALFWGSGLLKDTITLSAVAWLTYCIFTLFFSKRKRITNVILLIIMVYLIISIKPYIFVSLAPGLILWVFFRWVMKISNVVVRILTVPFTFVLVIAGASLLLSSMSGMLGVYGDVDSMVKKAQVTQEDLTNAEFYGSNYFDIGTIEASPIGILKKAPAAIMAGLFRPYIWEARSPFIILSALENLFLLIMVLYTSIKTGIKEYFHSIFTDPFLTFAFVFSVLFAFGIGIAAANFGAMVRYKIPLLPFFVSGMFIMLDHYRKKKQEREP